MEKVRAMNSRILLAVFMVSAPHNLFNYRAGTVALLYYSLFRFSHLAQAKPQYRYQLVIVTRYRISTIIACGIFDAIAQLRFNQSKNEINRHFFIDPGILA